MSQQTGRGWCPFAIHKPIPEAFTQPAIVPTQFIAHSAGGQSELYGWWQSDSSHGLESHVFIAGPETPGFDDGDLIQYLPIFVRADANGEANVRAVSAETASTANAPEPWSPKQVATLIRFITWCRSEAPGITARQIPTPTASGLGWHVMFGAPGPWTKVRGKVCPGPERIRQFRDEIIPAIAAGTQTPQPPKDWFDTMDEKTLRKILDDEFKARGLDAIPAKDRDGKGNLLLRVRNEVAKQGPRTVEIVKGIRDLLNRA